MPDPIVILDTIESSRVDDGLQGMQIFRGVTVKDIIFDVGQSPAEIWAKCLLAPGMPAKGSLMSASYPAILTNRRLAGIRQFNKTVRGELIYQAPPTFDGGTTINYTIVDAFQTAHILTSSTADGSENLYTLYKKGGDVHSAMTDTDAKAYPFEATKMVTFRSIRALGYATGTQWNAVKAGVRAAAGKLNSTPWGTHPRGSWAFLGPITRTQDAGQSYVIQLDFVRGDKDHHFYPIGFYRDILGRLPVDAATEENVLEGGLPVLGGIYRTNGASIASVTDESNWAGLFSFGPDS
jgi:hypothetical protein